MLEIDIGAVPRQRFRHIRPNELVPTTVADWAIYCKIPMPPNPVLGGIGESSIEDQADNALTVVVSDPHVDTGRIEAHELNRAGRGCRLCAFAEAHKTGESTIAAKRKQLRKSGFSETEVRGGSTPLGQRSQARE